VVGSPWSGRRESLSGEPLRSTLFVAWRYWGRQILTHIGVLVTAVYLASIGASLAFSGGLHLHGVWTAITAIFVIERVTVRDRGWKQMLRASTLVVEMSFDFFLQATQAKATWDTIRHTAQQLAVNGLAATGVNVIWLLLAAFALLGAGLAVLRIAPRREA
jgi:hypothetical protein